MSDVAKDSDEAQRFQYDDTCVMPECMNEDGLKTVQDEANDLVQMCPKCRNTFREVITVVQ